MLSKRSEKAINKSTAKVLPLVILGLIGFVSYVIVGPLAIEVLLRPPSGLLADPTAAVIIMVLYFILALFLVACYLRLLAMTIIDPDYIPRGTKHGKAEEAGSTPYPPFFAVSVAEMRIAGDYGGRRNRAAEFLKQITRRSLYVCQDNGYPIWCNKCHNWKDDRAHHCTEVDRCVFRMDHFCPWAGGVISEANFKIFIQFNGYAGFYCLFVGIVMAFYIAKLAHLGVNGHFVAVLILSALFGIFSFGMFGLSLSLAFRNQTTVEDLESNTRIWTLATVVPRDFAGNLAPGTRTISWPKGQTFAVIRTNRGENPFHCGHQENFRMLMGQRPWDWFLPITGPHLLTGDWGTSGGRYAVNLDFLNELRRKVGLPPLRGLGSEPSDH